MDVKMPTAGTVLIRIYNVAGEKVYQSTVDYASAGNYRAQWEGTNASGATVGNGLYLILIELPDGTRQIRKVVVLK
jgi:flagellar hook assembly protein FlgD